MSVRQKMPYQCDECRTLLSQEEISYRDKDLTLCNFCDEKISDKEYYKQTP